MADLYKQDGVNIAAGDAFSKFCAEINRATYQLSPYVDIVDMSNGNFRGPKGYSFVGLPEGCVHTGGMDGIGTKVIPIVASGIVKTTAENIIAMTAMDITRWGGLPLLFMNTLDVHSLGDVDSAKYQDYLRIMLGLEKVAHTHGYVLFTGETAELGPCVGSENPDAKLKFNWCGTMLGVYHPAKMILGDKLRPGQVIVALRDSFRSNGYSSVRKALALEYGLNWWDNPAALEDILASASPSVQYDRMLNVAHGWYSGSFSPEFEMRLIVHLSGGAFKSKLGDDILKKLDLSAEINDLFEPPAIMKKCATWRGMEPEECYNTWNGGQGAIVVVNAEQSVAFVSFAQQFGIEAKIAGRITEKREYTVAIKSQFGDGRTLYF